MDSLDTMELNQNNLLIVKFWGLLFKLVAWCQIGLKLVPFSLAEWSVDLHNGISDAFQKHI